MWRTRWDLERLSRRHSLSDWRWLAQPRSRRSSVARRGRRGSRKWRCDRRSARRGEPSACSQRFSVAFFLPTVMELQGPGRRSTAGVAARRLGDGDEWGVGAARAWSSVATRAADVEAAAATGANNNNNGDAEEVAEDGEDEEVEAGGAGPGECDGGDPDPDRSRGFRGSRLSCFGPRESSRKANVRSPIRHRASPRRRPARARAFAARKAGSPRKAR